MGKKKTRYGTLTEKILKLCPNAEFEDDDGHLIIKTGFAYPEDEQEDDILQSLGEVDDEVDEDEEDGYDEDEDEDEDEVDED